MNGYIVYAKKSQHIVCWPLDRADAIRLLDNCGRDHFVAAKVSNLDTLLSQRSPKKGAYAFDALIIEEVK